MQSQNGFPQRIVFFDGVCHLCNGFVDAVILRDPNHNFAFAPLQGSTAESLLSEKDRKNLDSVVYYENGKIYRESTAVLKILSSLSGPAVLSKVFFIIPTFLRDFIYRLIAKRRYHWFGEREFCRLPQAHERKYLLP
jgi:predicted DCC family thiol-disulfide oxidoreductase YuxK